MNIQATISAVEKKKEGTSKNGRAWTLWHVHTAEGSTYSTFDSGLAMVAFNSVGKSATIDFKQTEKGLDLVSLDIPEGQAEPQPEPVRAATETGAPDWDLIGLHKTRCALWQAVIGALGKGDISAQQLVAFGREIVVGAEEDIFHRAPAHREESIPF